MIPFSVLDLSPITAGSTAAQSLRNTLDLARHAERAGYLRYWLAEVVYQLRELSPALDPMYVAVRASGLGTYDKDEGYLLDFRYRDIGYNMRALDAYALALGLPLGNHMVLKAQYAIQNMDLVRGITDEEMRDAANDTDFFGMEIGVSF